MEATITAQENMERSKQEHWIPDKEIHMKDMRGYRYAPRLHIELYGNTRGT